MTDIVDRLREPPEGPGALYLMIEAAAEIERLRKTLREIEDSSNDPRAVREARAALGKDN